jgi:uncharacterized protein YndB with AHSA1/START domain
MTLKPAPVFSISRAFEAPRDLVWKAHSEAQHLENWWGPKGCKIRIERLEFRPGGLFHYVLRYSTGAEMWGRFIYREIAAPSQIHWINSFSNPGAGITRAPFSALCPLEMQNIAEFRESEGKTLLRLTSTPLGATDEENKFFADLFPSLEQGFGGTYDQLAGYLKRIT